MFVFPVLNSDYKSRKRTHRCCDLCRAKRTKCDITAADFALKGCANCRKHGLSCTFDGQSSKTKVTPRALPEPRTTQLESLAGYQTPLPTDMRGVDLPFLKRRFNFDAFRLVPSYLYLGHSHPKVIIALKTEQDSALWRNSGVYVTEQFAAEQRHPAKSLFNHLKRRKLDFLVSIYAFTVLSPEFAFSTHELRRLFELYFFKINSMFPLIDEKRFWADYSANRTPTLFKLVMVLVVLRDLLAEPILREVFLRSKNLLTQTSRLLDQYPAEEYKEDYHYFLDELDGKIRQLILFLPHLREFDKVSRLAVMLMLCMHFGYNRFGNEQSSQDLCAAVNLGVSTGIHMRPTPGRLSRQELEHTSNLWWCAFIFDRFNAYTNSRCLFLKHQDFNLDLPYHNPTLLRLVQLARTMETVLLSTCLPENPNIPVNGGSSNALFNFNEFEAIEFDYCDREISRSLSVFTPMTDEPKLSDYVNNSTIFMTRMFNNFAALIGQKDRLKDASVDPAVPKQNMVRAAANILWYWKKMDERYIINMPIFPNVLTMSLSVYMQISTGRLNASLQNGLATPRYTVEDFLSELTKYATKWWVVDEICNLAKSFIERNKLPRVSSKINVPVVESAASLQNIMNPEKEEGGWNIDRYDTFFENIHFDVFDYDYFKDGMAV